MLHAACGVCLHCRFDGSSSSCGSIRSRRRSKPSKPYPRASSCSRKRLFRRSFVCFFGVAPCVASTAAMALQWRCRAHCRPIFCMLHRSLLWCTSVHLRLCARARVCEHVCVCIFVFARTHACTVFVHVHPCVGVLACRAHAYCYHACADLCHSVRR